MSIFIVCVMLAFIGFGCWIGCLLHHETSLNLEPNDNLYKTTVWEFANFLTPGNAYELLLYGETIVAVDTVENIWGKFSLDENRTLKIEWSDGDTDVEMDLLFDWISDDEEIKLYRLEDWRQLIDGNV